MKLMAHSANARTPTATGAGKFVLMAAAALVVVPVLQGCGGGGDGGSAGAPTVAVRLVADLELGEPDQDEVLLGQVSEVVADDAGNIYVGDSRSNTLSAFSDAGTPLFTVGGRGDAPGQLQMAYQTILAEADSVMLFDYRPMFNVFGTAGGRFVQKYAVEYDLDVYAHNYEAVGISGSGLVVSLREWLPDKSGASDDRALVVARSQGGRAVADGPVLWRGPAPEQLHYVPNDGSGAMGAWTSKPQGRDSFCAVGEETLYCAENDSLEIDMVDVRSGVPRRLSIPFSPLVASSDDKRNWLNSLRDENFRALYTAPDDWRALEGMLVDRGTGRLWLKVRSSRIDSVQSWWIIDPGSDYRAATELDAAHTLHSVRNGKAYAVTRSDSGARWVTRFVISG